VQCSKAAAAGGSGRHKRAFRFLRFANRLF